LVFTRAKVAVFVDGCFWHGCPTHYRQPGSNVEYWIAKVDRNVRRDQEVDAALRELGWTVLRIWEHEDPVVAADLVERYVRNP
jgi:DNA mismatch endonuclease, patch repair protein